MDLDHALWLLLPVLVAVGTAILVYFLDGSTHGSRRCQRARDSCHVYKAQLEAHENRAGR